MAGTKRTRIVRERHQFNDYELGELLGCGATLLGGEGFCGDTAAMRAAWQQNEAEFLALWRSNWQPASKFAGWVEPRGPRASLPPGWHKFLGPKRATWRRT